MTNVPKGVVVPIPTFPLFATMKFVAVDEPTTNFGAPFTNSFPFTESNPHGEVVPMPIRPLLRIVNAAGLEVAYASVDVPIYRLPPIEEKSQCLLFAAALVSVRANDGRVPATWRFHCGVLVPMPTIPLYRAVRIGAVPVALLSEKIELFCAPLVVAFRVKLPLTPRPPCNIVLPVTSSVPFENMLPAKMEPPVEPCEPFVFASFRLPPARQEVNIAVDHHALGGAYCTTLCVVLLPPSIYT
jgi:hypothetical protein